MPYFRDDSWPEFCTRISPSINRAVAYLVSILVCAPYFYHLAHRSTAFLGLLEDDYFYYVIIADKLVTLGKMTYDGTTLTNGFHPLWFAILVCVRWVFGRFGTAFYIALALIVLACLIITFELGRRVARQLGASRALAGAVAAMYSVGTARLFSGGMECIVAVPLFLWLLIEIAKEGEITTRRAARVGFIASLAVLGRLDIALAVLLLIAGVAVFVRPRLREFSRLMFAFGAGGILVPLYAAANYYFFGTFLPVSALAKRLQTAPGFNLQYARGIALNTPFGPTVAIVLPLGLIALLLLWRRDGVQRPHARFAGGLALVFAFLFFGINALTGWIIFGWYEYPLVPGLIAALVFMFERWGRLVPSARVRAIAVALLVALAPILALKHYIEHGPRWSIADNSMLAMSYDLADHMLGRDGLFAMGAMGGVATYVLDKPVLQVEGIVADGRMVDHIRREEPLGDVLREYGADYLIVTLAQVRSVRRNGCYLVTQPNAEWAGERTAKMRGEICAEPIKHFFTPAGKNPWSIFPELETLVWDLRDAQWRHIADDDLPTESP